MLRWSHPRHRWWKTYLKKKKSIKSIATIRNNRRYATKCSRMESNIICFHDVSMFRIEVYRWGKTISIGYFLPLLARQASLKTCEPPEVLHSRQSTRIEPESYELTPICGYLAFQLINFTNNFTCDGLCTGPGLPSLCEWGVPILGDGCIGDIPLAVGLPGLCKTLDTDPGPGEWDTNGAGLCMGELCWVMGDAVGDNMGDWGVLAGWIGDEAGGPRGDCVNSGLWPGPGLCFVCCLFRYSFI